MKTTPCLNLATDKMENVPTESLVPRPAVFGIILRDKKVLLVPSRHSYILPGGGIDDGETHEQALIREVFEETGLKTEVGELVGQDEDYYISAYDGTAYHAIIYMYLCKNITGKVSTKQFSDYEKEFYRKAEWLTLPECKDLKKIYPKNILKLIEERLSA